MLTREDKVCEFHEAMGQPINEHMINEDLLKLRWLLLKEEFTELEEEFEVSLYDIRRGRVPGNLRNILKELADLQYVISGFAITFGMELDTAFNRVHESNMSKLGDDGKPIYREDGKVSKGPNYKPPKLGDLTGGHCR